MEILTLINGTFSNDEAKGIIENLFKSKIQFHEKKDFSSLERFGIHDKTAITRLPELRSNLNYASEIVEKAGKENKLLKINSIIEIEVIENKG